jgi:hypothetical protein
MQTTAKLLITERECAKLISVSPRHLHDIRKRGMVPCVKLGKSVRYNPEAVLVALQGNATQRALA